MPWTIEGVRIYVEEDTDWICVPRIGEINVLDSTETIIHRAGRPSYTRTIQFVVFSGYQANILPLCVASGITLVSDQGGQGDVWIKSAKAKRLLDTSRVTPVYRVTMELIKDGS